MPWFAQSSRECHDDPSLLGDRHRLLGQRARLTEVTRLDPGGDREEDQRVAHPLQVARLAQQPQGLGVDHALSHDVLAHAVSADEHRAPEVAGIGARSRELFRSRGVFASLAFQFELRGDHGERGPHLELRGSVAGLLHETQRLLEEVVSDLVGSLAELGNHHHGRHRVERRRSQRDGSPHVLEGLHHEGDDRLRGARREVRTQGDAETQQPLAPSVVGREQGEGGQDVVPLDVEPAQPGRLARPDQLRRGRLTELQEVRGVAVMSYRPRKSR